MKKITFIIILIISIWSCISSWISVNHLGYTLMPFLPLSYLIVYSLFLNKSIFYNKSIVAAVFSVLGFARYVILPLSISLTQSYGIGYIQISSMTHYNKAFLLMIYEVIIIGIIIYLFTSKFHKKFKVAVIDNKSKLKITGSKLVYSLLILLAMILFFTFPGTNTLLSFLTINGGEGIRVEEDLPTNLMIIRQVLVTTSIILYVIALDYTYRLYKMFNAIIYVYFAIFLSFIQISIIIGERRSFMVYTTFAVLFLLLKIFNKHKRKILFSILSVSSIVLIGMSIYKFFYAFTYDSYFEAIVNSNSQVSDIANYLQLYLLGPQNIAVSIEFASNNSIPINNLFFDIFRSTLGLNFLVKDIGMYTTTSLFNTFIYGGFKTTGHIISSIGYGYIYFGFILAPIFTVLITFFALFVEIKLKETTSFEFAYLLAYILIRSIMGIFTSITALLNVVSLMVISLGLIYLSARALRLLMSRRVKLI